MTRRKKSTSLMPKQKPNQFFNRQVKPNNPKSSDIAATHSQSGIKFLSKTDVNVVPYDENLLEHSRTQWQFGDWISLVANTGEMLQYHPDRAKIILLAAAGHFSLGNSAEASKFARLAMHWGCSKKFVSQILIAAVHNTLGRAYLTNAEDKLALNHFKDSIEIAQPDADWNFLSQLRAVREAAQLGLLPQAARLLDTRISNLKTSECQNQARISILETESQLLHHQLSLAQQRLQSVEDKAFDKEDILGNDTQRKAQLRKKSPSQLGQDLWVLEKSNYKCDGYFVEFGATDGVLLSNTWLLEKEFGWQGICAEPNPKFFEQLKNNRGCIVSNHYIGKETGSEVEFILADVYGGSREFAHIDQHGEKRGAYTTAGKVTSMISISLDDFLEKHKAPRDIDYISIDTEGSEYDLLSCFPFNKWNIRMLTIEHNATDQREKIFKLLNRYGYIRTECQWDDYYERQNENADNNS